MPYYLGALAVLSVLGLGTSVFFAAINTLLQTSSTDELRGRITSISSFVLFGCMPVGSIIMSIALKYASVQNILIVVGVIYLICSFTVVSSKDLSTIEIDKHHD